MIYKPHLVVERLNGAILFIKKVKESLGLKYPAGDVWGNSTLLHIQFKTERLCRQFNLPLTTTSLSPKLISIIMYSAWFFDAELNQPFVITGLQRTQGEQDSIYKNDERYKVKPWKSVHQFGRGCDVRIRHLKMEEINKFVANVNTHFRYPDHVTALYERDHVHLQVPA
jgi:hypothetical protein